LTILLEMDGFEVSQSPRPGTALDQGKANSVDAFLIDCHLAGFDGLELLREIRADADLASSLVIMSSGRDLEREALEAGADLFLLKPFSPSELSATLSELMRERQGS